MKGTYLFVTFLYFIPINTNRGNQCNTRGARGRDQPSSHVYYIKDNLGFALKYIYFYCDLINCLFDHLIR